MPFDTIIRAFIKRSRQYDTVGIDRANGRGSERAAATTCRSLAC